MALVELYEAGISARHMNHVKVSKFQTAQVGFGKLSIGKGGKKRTGRVYNSVTAFA